MADGMGGLIGEPFVELERLKDYLRSLPPREVQDMIDRGSPLIARYVELSRQEAIPFMPPATPAQSEPRDVRFPGRRMAPVGELAPGPAGVGPALLALIRRLFAGPAGGVSREEPLPSPQNFADPFAPRELR